MGVLYKPTPGCRFGSIDHASAEALLLGLWYDTNDHTFNQEIGNNNIYYCADTLKILSPYGLRYRRALVQAGQLGFTAHIIAGP